MVTIVDQKSASMSGVDDGGWAPRENEPQVEGGRWGIVNGEEQRRGVTRRKALGKASEREAEGRLGASVRAGEPDWVTDGGGAVQDQDQGQVEGSSGMKWLGYLPGVNPGGDRGDGG